MLPLMPLNEVVLVQNCYLSLKTFCLKTIMPAEVHTVKIVKIVIIVNKVLIARILII